MSEINGAYVRRQEMKTTKAIADVSVKVLLENEILYVEHLDGTVSVRLGDGVTPIKDLPAIIDYQAVKEEADRAEQQAGIATVKAVIATEKATEAAEIIAPLNERIDNLVATPVPTGEIIAEEIIDARQGKGSLGANLTAVKTQINSLDAEVMSQLAQTKTQVSGLSASKAEKTDVNLELDKKLNKNGSISVTQINKNLGKIDQTYLTDELLQQITGGTPVNATPPDGGITTPKIANKAVEIEKLSDKTLQTLMNNRIYNLITNGDFLNTTGWTELNASVSASDNTLKSTGNGSSATVGTSFETADTSISGNKYFAKVSAKVTNANCTLLRLRILDRISGQTIGTADIANPAIDQWYDLSSIITPSTTNLGKMRFQIIHVYLDAATANGKVLEVKYANMINLTKTYGAGQEPNLAKMQTIINSYTNSYISNVANKNDGDMTLLKNDLGALVATVNDWNALLTNENETWEV